MRTFLTAFVALCFSWSAGSASYAGDHQRAPLPGVLGRFCGIGYSAGYHARHPSRPAFVHHALASHTDRATPYETPYPSGTCPQCSGSPLPSVSHDAHPRPSDWIMSPSTQPLPPAAPAALAPSHSQTPVADPSPSLPSRLLPKTNEPPTSLQQPSNEASPSDRAGFLKRLPNLRGGSNVSDLPAPPRSPKKASVARSSILDVEAR